MTKPEERTVEAVWKKYKQRYTMRQIKSLFMKEAGDDFKEPVSEREYNRVCDDIESLPSYIKENFKVI